ncbi:hypothetical protein Pmani_003066 [Petrolisthes manimaculis]|uniref:Uncharacterized protein n=1 Tax=Petrolisthes manimaculis TaxID=1843537 RepID=A0AAE1QJ95_9EUCA|nr:hypothetical protein Pmani_003066 [Petrolisthes manimaculis]
MDSSSMETTKDYLIKNEMLPSAWKTRQSEGRDREARQQTKRKERERREPDSRIPNSLSVTAPYQTFTINFRLALWTST